MYNNTYNEHIQNRYFGQDWIVLVTNVQTSAKLKRSNIKNIHFV